MERAMDDLAALEARLKRVVAAIHRRPARPLANAEVDALRERLDRNDATITELRIQDARRSVTAVWLEKLAWLLAGGAAAAASHFLWG